MPAFSQIVIIYNPNSTGSSRLMARRLLRAIKNKLPDQPVELIPTERASHAEAIAYDMACQHDEPLMLSSSGDGGYHEVVNGIMRAKEDGFSAIAGLIPAGNANDHFHATQRHELIDCIVERNLQSVDLLVLTASVQGRSVSRYGHSYIGLGITPKVGKKLNKTKLNAVNQYVIAAKILFRSQAISLELNGKVERYDSLIFSNIDRMSRLLTLSRDARIDDGKFEVTAVNERPKWQLLKLIFKAAAIGLDESWQTDRFAFKTIESIDVQIDGEIYRLDEHSPVEVGIKKQVLKRII